MLGLGVRSQFQWMTERTRLFVWIVTALGAVQILSAAGNWHSSDPKLFLIYLVAAVICSAFQVRGASPTLSISVSLPVILLSIVQLNLVEAVAVGSVAALAQNLWSSSGRLRVSQIVIGACTLATVIATANLVYQALLPKWTHSDAMRFSVASVALFVANTFPAAIVARMHQTERLGRIWKESYFWLFPYYLVAAAIANALKAASTGISLETALIVLPVLYLAYRYYTIQRSLLEEQKEHAGNMAALHLRAIESLALAVEAKDNLNTRGHLRRVQIYALGVGTALGLSSKELDALHAAALLHDIGKLAVPEHILTKPGKLTPEEFAKMKVHPLVGAEIVEQVQFPYPVAPIVRAHHEKWDGSGYPFGLKGDDIPLGARILSVADCLDALTSNREYRQAIPLNEGVQQIAAEAGKSFDPAIVDVLMLRYRELDQMALENLDGNALLSKHRKVEKGKAPDAGLDVWALPSSTHDNRPTDFLSTISSAGREGQLLRELGQELASTLDLTEICDRLEHVLRSMIPAEAMAIFLRQGNVLLLQFASRDHKDAFRSVEPSLGEGLVGWIALNQQAIVNGNPMVEPGFRSEPNKPLKAALAIPIDGAASQLGVIALYRSKKDAFSRDDLRILMAAAPNIATALENALKFREMEIQAHSDALTNLPDLYLMMKSLQAELGQVRRSGQSLALAVMKLSGFSSAYQILGEPAANDLLQSVSNSIKSNSRRLDHVARIGEDTFALVLPGINRDDLARKMSKLASLVASPDLQVSPQLTIQLMTGEALYPDDGDEANLLLTIAKRRMEQHLPTDTESILALNSQSALGSEAPSQVGQPE